MEVSQTVSEGNRAPTSLESFLFNNAIWIWGWCLFSVFKDISSLKQRFGVHAVVAPCPEIPNFVREDRRSVVHHFSLKDRHGCLDEFKGPLWLYCDGNKRGQAEVKPFRICLHLDWIDVCLLCGYSHNLISAVQICSFLEIGSRRM